MTYTYSVIIPHKNTQDLLERCLASIPKRPDIQVIIVDDNSDPEKVDFGQLKVLEGENCMVIFDKQGKGAGAARNIGLTFAKGAWLVFSDSDDFFTEGAFDEFDKYADSENDIVFFKMSSVYSDTLQPADRGDLVNKLIDEYGRDSSIEDGLRYRFVNPVCKMVRKSLVDTHRISFDEVPAANDVMFSIKTGHWAKKVTGVDFASYCATVRSGSLKNHISITNQRSRFDVFIRQYQFMESIGRKDLRYELLSPTLQMLKEFGWSEFLRCVKIARENHVNILLGVWKIPFKLLKPSDRSKQYKKYTVKDNK